MDHMGYAVGLLWIDVKESCLDEYPLDCLYAGGRMLCIHPDGCVDCETGAPACPVEAIRYEDDPNDQWHDYTADKERFFREPLPVRDTLLGSPGGAAKLGPLPFDTPLIVALPPEIT
jgi:NAD-dependent dihydropyrimidine dehydrogenase PreA subunit